MSTATKMGFHYTYRGMHFTREKEEFLALLFSGEVVIRSLTASGSQHIHIEKWPKLLPWIFSTLGSDTSDFAVGIHPLPKAAPRRIRIRSVVTLLVVDDDHYPVVLTREPLRPQAVEELLKGIPPVLALLNAGQVYLNSSAPFERPDLA
jgi:hypothetical protein